MMDDTAVSEINQRAFGNVIRTRRRKLGLSQGHLAERSGFARFRIAELEYGVYVRIRPGIKTIALAALAGALGWEWTTLLDQVDIRAERQLSLASQG